jgi:hypothetical protein
VIGFLPAVRLFSILIGIRRERNEHGSSPMIDELEEIRDLSRNRLR